MQNVQSIMAKKKSEILKKWFNHLLSSYPHETQAVLQKNDDQFANPVGSTFLEALETVYDALFIDSDKDKVLVGLDRIIRIRAVQNFTASQAVAFVPALGRIVKEEFGVQGSVASQAELERALESVEGAMFMAFDLYSQCMKNLFQIRADEFKNNVYMLLRKAELITGETVENPV